MEPNQQGITYALDIIRPRWNAEIIMLLSDGTKRYNKIKSAINGISTKVLTQSLQLLEKSGIIY